jgi:hypothetical protein
MIHRKAAIGVGVLVLAGLGAVAVHSYSVKASAPDATAPVASAPAEPMPAVPAIVPTTGTATAGAAATPVATTGTRVVYRDRVVYRTAAPRYYVHRRSKKHSAEIIGGSALGGAGIGALVGGGKGALIGGLVGGAAGTAYDRTTHKKVVRE